MSNGLLSVCLEVPRGPPSGGRSRSLPSPLLPVYNWIQVGPLQDKGLELVGPRREYCKIASCRFSPPCHHKIKLWSKAKLLST